MVNYQNSKIYKIICNITGQIYIGSTTKKYLSMRLAGHVGAYKNWLKGETTYVTSFKIIENDDYDIILIENYPCNSKDELHARERYWTSQIDCINKVKNQGLYNELGKVEYDKHYYETNKDKILEATKQYRENNIDKIKQYREATKDKMSERNKQYYKDNKEKRKEYRKKYYEANKK